MDSTDEPVVDAVPEMEPDATNADAKGRMTWSASMDTALLAQVILTGVKAFVTSKANTAKMKPEEKWNQEHAWTNEEDGILPMLWQGDAEFKKFKMPAYGSVLNHLTAKKTGLFDKHKHLFTPGMEQAEPAEAGTEETKDEAPLTDMQSALIECHDLYKEAKEIEEKKKAKSQGERNADAAEGKKMQDEAVRKRYGELNEDELKKKTEQAQRGKQPAGADACPGSSAKKGKKKKICVSEFCEQNTDYTEEGIIDGGNVPDGYTLEKVGDDYFLVPAAVLSFRDKIGKEAAEWTKIKKDRELNRKDERKRELDHEDRKLSLEEAKDAREAKKAKAELKERKQMLKLMAAIASKFGGGGADSDSDDDDCECWLPLTPSLWPSPFPSPLLLPAHHMQPQRSPALLRAVGGPGPRGLG